MDPPDRRTCGPELNHCRLKLSKWPWACVLRADLPISGPQRGENTSERFGAVTVVGQRPAEDEGPVFLLSLDYSKPVYDPASGYSFFAVTTPSGMSQK